MKDFNGTVRSFGEPLKSLSRKGAQVEVINRHGQWSDVCLEEHLAGML